MSERSILENIAHNLPHHLSNAGNYSGSSADLIPQPYVHALDYLFALARRHGHETIRIDVLACRCSLPDSPCIPAILADLRDKLSRMASRLNLPEGEILECELELTLDLADTSATSVNRRFSGHAAVCRLKTGAIEISCPRKKG